MNKTLIVLMHGLGSNGEDLESLIPFLAPYLPNAEFFSPNGIEPCDLFPFGFQWFSLQDRGDQVMIKELERTSDSIRNMIKTKAESLSIDPSNIILIGFSQGTMTSLYLALTNEIPYKAVVGFSGSLIMPSNIIQKNTPICLIHGAEDDVVPARAMELARNKLASEGIKAKTHLYHDLAHSIDLRGLKTAIAFIKEQNI